MSWLSAILGFAAEFFARLIRDAQARADAVAIGASAQRDAARHAAEAEENRAADAAKPGQPIVTRD